MNNVTNAEVDGMPLADLVKDMSRPEKRRTWKLLNKRDDYEASGFWDASSYRGVRLKSVSKYTPHIGAKQKAKGLKS